MKHQENHAMTDPLTCGYCGRAISKDARDDSKLHEDHIVPHSRGGGDDARNRVNSCTPCNLEKSDRTPSEWKPEGLPAWLYEVEALLVVRYKMRARSRKEKVAVHDEGVEVSGFALLVHRWPACTEHERKLCKRPADFEVCIPGLGPWTAKCARCVEYYRKSNCRELTSVDALEHILVQLRDGVLDPQEERTIATLARLGGVSLAEYLDLAQKMISGDATIRESLKLIAPQLRLELWEPRTVSR